MSEYLDRFEDGDRVEDRGTMSRTWLRENGQWYIVYASGELGTLGKWVNDDYMFLAIGKGYIKRVASE